MQSEQQQRIMGYFIEEAKDHLNTIEQGLLNLQSTIGDSEMVSEVFRAAHSVKGGAAMLGLNSIQQTAHRLEDYFKVLKECPIKVDQKLESLFLRVFDTLQELLEQLQGPFGLTDDKADEVMSEVEPVFNSLNEHLTVLVNQCGGTPPDDVELAPISSIPVATVPIAASNRSVVAREESALQLIFKSDVPVRLREMLQLFKQSDSGVNRQQLQDICRSLAQAGEQFDLPNWCELLNVAERAIANSDNTYRTLAPIVIKDIKQAQECVLSGQVTAIVPSETLKALAPITVEDEAIDEVIDEDFANLLAEIDFEDDSSIPEFIEFELQTEEQPLANVSGSADEDISDDSDWFNVSTVIQEDFGSDIDFGFAEPAPASSSSTFDNLGLGDDLDEATASNQSADQNGPEVGIAELNSLADLFEGEVPDLGMTWQEEEIIGDSSAELSGIPDLDVSNDLSDFLFDQDNLEDLDLETDNEDDDLSALLNNSERDSHLETTLETSPPASTELSELPPNPWDTDSGALGESLSSIFSLPDEPAETLVSSEREPGASDLDNLGALFATLDETELEPDSIDELPQIEGLDDEIFSAQASTSEAVPSATNPFEIDDLFGGELPESQSDLDQDSFVLTDLEQDGFDDNGLEVLEDLASDDDLIDALLQDDTDAELLDEPVFGEAASSDVTDPWSALDEEENESTTTASVEESSSSQNLNDQDLTSDLWGDSFVVPNSSSSQLQESEEAIAPEEDWADLFSSPSATDGELETSELETSFDFSNFNLAADELNSFDSALTEDFSNDNFLLNEEATTPSSIDELNELSYSQEDESQLENLDALTEPSDTTDFFSFDAEQPESLDALTEPSDTTDFFSFDAELSSSLTDAASVSAADEVDEDLIGLLNDDSDGSDLSNLEASLDFGGLDEDEAYLAGLFEDGPETIEPLPSEDNPVAFTDAFEAFETAPFSVEDEAVEPLNPIDNLFTEEINWAPDAESIQATDSFADFALDSETDLVSNEEALDLELHLNDAFTIPDEETSNDSGIEFNEALEFDAISSIPSTEELSSTSTDFDNTFDSFDSDNVSLSLEESFADSIDFFDENSLAGLDNAEAESSDANMFGDFADLADLDNAEAESSDASMFGDFADLTDLDNAEAESSGASMFGDFADLADLDNAEAESSDASMFGDFADLTDLDQLLSEDSGSLDVSQPDASSSSGLDDLGDLNAFLDERPSALSGSSDSDSLADISLTDLNDFEDLDAFLGEEPSQTFSASVPDVETTPTDDFADLDALLADPSASSTNTTSSEFSSLEALLEEGQPASLAARSTPATPTSRLTDSSEFDDLEKLLEDADQTLGGSPTNRGARGPSLVATRGKTRPTRGVLSDQTMRVSVKNLDNLNNLVGELVVNRNSLEQAEERLRQFLDNLLYQVQQLSDVGQRMRDLYERSLLESSLLSGRKTYQHSSQGNGGFAGAQNSHATGVSFDALEMDRFTGFHTLSQEMIELIVRVRESASDIDFVVDETDQVTRNFRQITTQLQEGLTRSRMVPFAQTADRLPRAVRDISLKCGKQAELTVEGRETLIDKMILEQLYDPMTHLVNNAITHGIETPEERSAANKPPTGRIVVRTFHQGNQTVISVTDDGAGINPDIVKRKAIEKGLITAAEAEQMSRLDVYDLLFHHGFSTKDKADDYAGRGVGMDVVRTSLNEIRGVINIDSMVGKGTTFTIRLPLTLSISKALCCISNRARIAFPMDGVEDMLDVPKERVQRDSQNRPCIQWRDQLLPFQPLSELLRYNRSLGRGSVYGGNQEDDIISVVVLRSNAGNFLALQVDQVLGEQEIVIKQLEGPVPKPVGVAGATVLGDGRIMPIADVLELIDLSMGRIRREAGSSLWEKDEDQVPPEAVDTKTEPTVLIVDDSITVRELLSMTFSKIGYRVEQARDGQEAWEKLRSGLPCDLVFCDIEMPRMDGLELLSRIQKDPTLSHLPIAMLTSRGADRHRQMAIQLGAKGYFTKPYLEEALLDAAQRMLKGEVLVTSAG